ncbi:hypothetical protein llap_2318 [Limosa lapponica baueri]|uniref:Uncharacterized protein n=1 Tax=Limosa lapponica baueri TaxID=1758121 RepID=A0A2I0UMV3_LIMLA|nr:hypothetical protein llap_2318 [Limosa lapponica baueri]
MLLLMQPRMHLALWAAGINCQVILSCSPTNTPSPSRQGCSASFSTQPIFVLGIDLIHVQNLALGLFELHEVHMGPLLKPVQVPLDGILSLQHGDCATDLGIVGKLAEGALNPTVHVANINSAGPSTDPLVTACHLDIKPLSTSL